MKKVISGIMAFVMAFSMIIASAGSNVLAANDAFALPTQAEVLKNAYNTTAKGQVVYGSTTDVNADFLSGWSNSATNQDIKTLIYGYDTVVFSKDETFEVNPVVVKSWSSVMNANKTKTYTFEIYDNLVYNDKTKITAKDFLFGTMLMSSPEWMALGANPTSSDIFTGYENFSEGKTKTFTGFRLINDYTFSVTLKASEVPNYFELAYIGMGPLPMHVIAPGVTLTDTGRGATLSKEFTTDLLKKTIMDPKTGYRYNPKVTAGPYNLKSYDTSSKTAIIEVNPTYLGNYDGSKPLIKTLVWKKVVQATMIDELAAGSVNMLAGVSSGDQIESGLDLVEQDKVSSKNYPRAGYGKIAFQCDFSPTQFKAVRQAIAWCLDRDEFCYTFTNGHGMVVNGAYGASQWEYKENRAELSKQLTNYTYNLDKAKEVLIADGWTLNSSGGAYVEGSGVRYKRVDGELMPLVIEWLSSENNQVSDMIASMLPSEVEKIGMKINQTVVDFATLQMHLNRNGIDEPKYSMYNLATGFNTTTPWWYYYSKDPKYFGNYNPNFIADSELDKIVVSMKNIDPTDKETWSQKWLEMQVKWNELLPDIPLYSNIYYDFYSKKIGNYNPSPLWSYRYAVQYAFIN